jgi:hypothetical protein
VPVHTEDPQAAAPPAAARLVTTQPAAAPPAATRLVATQPAAARPAAARPAATEGWAPEEVRPTPPPMSHNVRSLAPRVPTATRPIPTAAQSVCPRRMGEAQGEARGGAPAMLALSAAEGSTAEPVRALMVRNTARQAEGGARVAPPATRVTRLAVRSARAPRQTLPRKASDAVPRPAVPASTAAMPYATCARHPTKRAPWVVPAGGGSRALIAAGVLAPARPSAMAVAWRLVKASLCEVRHGR